MADIEIVKVGLKYHRDSHEEGCVQGSQACPYIANGDGCFHILLDDALSVINEQQAEIERLKAGQPKDVRCKDCISRVPAKDPDCCVCRNPVSPCYQREVRDSDLCQFAEGR